MNYAISAKSRYGTCKADNKTITFTASHDTDQCFFSMDIVFNHWEDAFYLLIPACAYGGNRFPVTVTKFRYFKFCYMESISI